MECFCTKSPIMARNAFYRAASRRKTPANAKRDCCTSLCSSPCGVIRGYGSAGSAALLIGLPSADDLQAAYAAAGLEAAVLCRHQAGIHCPADGLQLCGIGCHIVEQCRALGSGLACGSPQCNSQLLTVSGDRHTLGQNALQVGGGACNVSAYANGCPQRLPSR